MTSNYLLSCAATFGLGILFGKIHESSEESFPPVAARTAAMGDLGSGANTSDALSRRSLSTQARPGIPDLSSTDATVSVPRALLQEMSLAAGKRSLKSDLFPVGGFIEKHLEITDHEKARLETEWRNAKEKVKELEASACTVEFLKEGPATITVPNLSLGVESIGSEFQASLSEVLGENRAGIFASLNQLEEVFAIPGGERTYEIKFEPVPDERWRFHITSSSEAGRQIFVTEDLLPDEIRHLADAVGLDPHANQK